MDFDGGLNISRGHEYMRELLVLLKRIYLAHEKRGSMDGTAEWEVIGAAIFRSISLRAYKSR